MLDKKLRRMKWLFSSVTIVAVVAVKSLRQQNRISKKIQIVRRKNVKR